MHTAQYTDKWRALVNKVIIRSLFNDASSGTDYVESNERMICE
jgi:hypothetical protein